MMQEHDVLAARPIEQHAPGSVEWQIDRLNSISTTIADELVALRSRLDSVIGETSEGRPERDRADAMPSPSCQLSARLGAIADTYGELAVGMSSLRESIGLT